MNSRLYGSFPRSYLGVLPRWEGEVYYLGFFDHALSDEHITHNFNCSIPPSLPSLTQQVDESIYSHCRVSMAR